MGFAKVLNSQRFGNIDVPKCRTLCNFTSDLPTVLLFGNILAPSMCQSVELSAISLWICREFYILGAQMCQSVELSPKWSFNVAATQPTPRLDSQTVLHFGNMEVPKCRTIANLISDLPRVLHFGTSMWPKCCQRVELSAISAMLGEVENHSPGRKPPS